MSEVSHDASSSDARPESPPDAVVAPQPGSDRQETSRAALLKIQSLLPELVQLSVLSQSASVQNAIGQVRNAVERKLTERGVGGREERDRRLMVWAKRHGVSGMNAYYVQGSLIRMGISWMNREAEALFAEAESPAISLDDLKTAGFRTLKGLAYHYDPFVHGDCFLRFSERFVTSAMTHCLRVGALVVPNEARFEEILSYRTNGESLPDAPPPERPLPPHCPEQRKAPKPPQQTLPDPPRPPQPPEPERTPEEQEEQKRQRRFCRWAKDEYQIPVSQDQFEEAVRQIAEKHHSLANGVVDKLHIHSSFHGGKKAVRHEAARLLPLRIREFDPAGGEHFNRFVSQWLELKLKEMVKGK